MIHTFEWKLKIAKQFNFDLDKKTISILQIFLGFMKSTFIIVLTSKDGKNHLLIFLFKQYIQQKKQEVLPCMIHL